MEGTKAEAKKLSIYLSSREWNTFAPSEAVLSFPRACMGWGQQPLPLGLHARHTPRTGHGQQPRVYSDPHRRCTQKRIVLRVITTAAAITRTMLMRAAKVFTPIIFARLSVRPSDRTAITEHISFCRKRRKDHSTRSSFYKGQREYQPRCVP